MLVTNQLQYARPADTILYMADGRIAEAGSYEELMAAGGGFAELMNQTEVRVRVAARCVTCAWPPGGRSGPLERLFEGACRSITSCHSKRLLCDASCGTVRCRSRASQHCKASSSSKVVCVEIFYFSHRDLVLSWCSPRWKRPTRSPLTRWTRAQRRRRRPDSHHPRCRTLYPLPTK